MFFCVAGARSVSGAIRRRTVGVRVAQHVRGHGLPAADEAATAARVEELCTAG